MKIPKYVQEIMERSEFVRGYGDPGYTIKIRKATPYTRISTLSAEIQRLQSWVDRMMPKDEFSIPTMVINSIPSRTHYRNQYTVVTIYDPIMGEIEKYMRKEMK